MTVTLQDIKIETLEETVKLTGKCRGTQSTCRRIAIEAFIRCIGFPFHRSEDEETYTYEIIATKMDYTEEIRSLQKQLPTGWSIIESDPQPTTLEDRKTYISNDLIEAVKYIIDNT